MTNPFRAMCAELLNGLDELAHPRYPFPGYTRCAMDRARALLDQPEPEGPTDEDLTLTYAYAVAAAVDNKRGPFKQEEAEAAQLAGLRAVLAKWGRPTPQPPTLCEFAATAEYALLELRSLVTELCDAEKWIAAERLERAADVLEASANSAPANSPQPPADGEVAELVEWLLREADYQEITCKRAPCADRIRRVAELLQRQHPQPPVDGEVAELVWVLINEADADDRCDHTHWLSGEQMRRIADLLQHPQPPADGEVAELVETLKGIAYWRRHGKPGGIVPGFFDIRQADRLDRAAEILERFALPACLVINPDKEALAVSMAADLAGPGRIELLPDDAQIIKPAEHPQPVPVIERPWEREGWCDEQGRCWLRRKHEEDGVTWRLMAPASVFDDAMPIYYAEALPANALPTPRPPMDEITINLSSVPTSCRLTQPASKWRLARRNGEPILQAGIEWEDVPTASLDTTENTA